MKRLWVRLSFVIIILTVILTSGYRLLHSERQRKIQDSAASAYDALAWTLTVVLADLRSSQQAYVATGQDPNKSYIKVTTGLDRLKNGLTDLQVMSKSSEATEAITTAYAHVKNLESVDESARDHTTLGQILLASDLVFTDGHELAQQATEQLGRARTAESEARLQQLAEFRTDDVITTAVAATVLMGVTLMLLPLPGKPAKIPEPTTAERPLDTIEETAPANVSLVATEWEINQRDAVDATRVSTLQLNQKSTFLSQESTLPPEGSDLTKDPGQPSPRTVVPDLTTTAQLCTDIGRVSASDELSGLLSRIGDLLNASGLIVWVRDSSGQALRPATGHGYTPQALAQLGRVACDDENATATAYRTAQIQIVSSSENSPGAVAVPLISTSADTGGCIGVLSAEVRNGWETSNGVQATAMILAAQLATVVTADPTAAEHEARDQAQAYG
jgi:hypothetical protein